MRAIDEAVVSVLADKLDKSGILPLLPPDTPGPRVVARARVTAAASGNVGVSVDRVGNEAGQGPTGRPRGFVWTFDLVITVAVTDFTTDPSDRRNPRQQQRVVDELARLADKDDPSRKQRAKILVMARSLIAGDIRPWLTGGQRLLRWNLVPTSVVDSIQRGLDATAGLVVFEASSSLDPQTVD